MIAPVMPVRMTNTAVRDGMPPIFSAMPMAIGVVTDFGASDNSVWRLAPKAHAMPTADTIAVTDAGREAEHQRHPQALQLGALVVQRQRQCHRGRSKQEMDELRAFEIRRVRGAGDLQQHTSSTTAMATGLASGLKRTRS